MIFQGSRSRRKVLSLHRNRTPYRAGDGETRFCQNEAIRWKSPRRASITRRSYPPCIRPSSTGAFPILRLKRFHHVFFRFGLEELYAQR